MKQYQVTVDFANMVFTACSYLALAGAVWIFLRLVQACFWLPRHLQKQNDVQRMLQDKVESYEKYILECEEKEKIEKGTNGEVVVKDAEQEEKWKERRECLEMLKRELNRVRDNSDSQDWDYLLEEEEAKDEEMGGAVETQDNQDSKDKCANKLNAYANMEEKVEIRSEEKKIK